MAETQTAPPTKKTKGTDTGVVKPWRLLFFTQKSADLLAVETSLSQAIANRNGSAGSLVGDAVSAFSKLGDAEKTSALHTINSRLRSSSKGLGKPVCSFSNPDPAGQWSPVPAQQKAFEEGVHATNVLASFIKSAVACLPRQDGDLVITKAHKNLHKTLARIIKKALSARSHDGSHVQAALASADALWGLEYGHTDFWTGLLNTPPTRSLTITKFLEMDGNRASPSHGWHYLQEHMADFWLDIARNPSPLAIDFLVNTTSNKNDGAVVYAFRAAAYLTEIPPQLVDIAQRMQLPPKKPIADTADASQKTIVAQPGPEPIACNPEVQQAAVDFLFVIGARGLISRGGESAFAGVFSLVMLYRAGEGAWLRPMLDAICAETEAQARTNGPETAEHRHALLILGALGIAGVRAPHGVSATGGIYLPTELGRISWDLIDSLPSLSIVGATGEYAKDGYEDVRCAAMRVFDRLRLGKLPVQLKMDEAARLVPDIITVRNYYDEKSDVRLAFDSALADLGAGLVDVVVSPPGSDEKARAAARQAARGIITTIRNAGILVPHSDFLDASIAFTLHSASPIPQEVIAPSILAGPLNCMFAAGIYLPAIPAELLAFAATVHERADDPVTRTFAKDFMFMNEARGLLAQEGHRRFAGALGAALLFKAGKSELAPFMNDIIRTSLQDAAAGKEQPAGAAGKKKADAATNTGEADKAGKEDGEQSAEGPSDIAKARAETAHSILVAFTTLGVMQGGGIKVPAPSFTIPQNLLTASLDAPLAECVLMTGTYLDPAAAELTAFADEVYGSTTGNEHLKALAWEFLLITEALERINCADGRQFEGVQTLTDLYKGGRTDLGLMLQCAGAEMADLIMKPPTGEGQESQSALAWAAINRIEKAGMSLTYHKLHAASYLSAVPDEITHLAEGILAQPEPEESLAAAARDLLAIKEVKDLLARDSDNERVCTYALANLAATGTGNLKDMLEAIGTRQVLVMVNGDNPARHRAMRLLTSLRTLNVPGDALFAAGLDGGPGSISPTLLSAAEAISASKDKYPDSLKLAAHDLVTLNTARLNLAGIEQQFDGASALADLYLAGRTEIAALLDRDAGPKMVEAFKAAEGPEAQEPAAKAIRAIHAARPEAITGLPAEQLDAILNRGKADGSSATETDDSPAQKTDDDRTGAADGSPSSETGDSNE